MLSSLQTAGAPQCSYRFFHPGEIDPSSGVTDYLVRDRCDVKFKEKQEFRAPTKPYPHSTKCTGCWMDSLPGNYHVDPGFYVAGSCLPYSVSSIWWYCYCGRAAFENPSPIRSLVATELAFDFTSAADVIFLLQKRPCHQKSVEVRIVS